jgi:hypothetical protein
MSPTPAAARVLMVGQRDVDRPTGRRGRVEKVPIRRIERREDREALDSCRNTGREAREEPVAVERIPGTRPASVR